MVRTSISGTTNTHLQHTLKDASFKVEPAKSGRKLETDSGIKCHRARELRNKKDSETSSGPAFFLETQGK